MRFASAARLVLLVLARLIGLAGALSATVLWSIFIFFNPYYSPDQGSDPGPYVKATMMILLAIAASWATTKLEAGVLFLAFLASFPIGLYVMLTPSIFKWVGVCNLAYLVALVLILAARPLSPR